MNKYKFSRRSKKALKTCHKDLQLIMGESIKLSNIDFGISEGYRSLQDQLKYYHEGKSKIDGIIIKGKHNYDPSLAVDIYLWINNKVSYDINSFLYVIGLIDGIAKMLYKQNKITHLIRSGANWDSDDKYLSDQSFDDLPHLELIK